jgi:hypothetical protein
MENSDLHVLCCETGSGMHYGSGSGFGSGSYTKYNENQIIKNERPTFWKIILILALKGKILY